MPAVTWVVKASKFCNLRCTYCYEWDELSDSRRISPPEWRGILLAVRRYGELQSARLGSPVQSRIVWHGGEPLLLPASYMREVVALQHEVFGGNAIARGEVRNFIQTNLTVLPQRKLDFLAAAGFDLWFSFDWVPGVRLDRRRRETGEAVAKNLRRVLESGLNCFGVTVLAAHTRDYLREIHDQYIALGVDFRILPVFDAQNLTPDSPLNISADAVVEMLSDVFVHWFERGCRVRVFPLEDYLATALLNLAGLERPRRARRELGDEVLVVNTDGALYAHNERYVRDRELGNLFRQPIDDIVGSPSYAASLDRNDALLARHCERCRFFGACDGVPVQSHPHRWPEGPCPVASRVCAFIEDYCRAEGVDGNLLEVLSPWKLPGGAQDVAAIEL